VLFCRISLTGSREFPSLSHAGWISDSFFSRRREHGCIPVRYVLIITLLVPPVKWFPVLPSIMMHCPHTKDGNKYKEKPHHSKTPRSVHYTPNKKLYVVHQSSSSSGS